MMNIFAATRTLNICEQSMRKISLSKSFSFAILLAAGTAASAQDPNPDPMPPSPAEQYVVSESGVDMRTGQHTFSNTDLSIGGAGGLSLTRNNGENDWKKSKIMGQFSHNWHIYATYKSVKGGGARFAVIGGGRGQGFGLAQNTNNFTVRSVTQRSSMKAIPTGSGPLDRYLVYTAADGTEITFREDGQHGDSPYLNALDSTQKKQGFFASKIEEPDGTTYTLSYDEPTSALPAYLRRVTSNRGYAMVFEYITVAGFKYVSKVCAINLAVQAAPANNICPAGVPSASYSYGSNGHMTSFTDALNRTHGYTSTYSVTAWEAALDNWPSSDYEWTETFIHPGETTPYLTVTKYRWPFYEYTKSQVFADGRTYNFSWQIVEHNEYTMEVAGGNWTRNDGATTSVGFEQMKRLGWVSGDAIDISNGPDTILDTLGRSYSGSYCETIVAAPHPPFPGGQTGCAAVSLRYWISPEGNKTEFTHDQYGNVLEIRQKAKTGSSLADIVTTASYNCATELLCKKPQSTTDANGNLTDYTYSSTTGQPLTVTGPAVNGIRPQTRYTYTLRSARDVNGNALQPPISLLTQESTCKTTAASGAGCAGGAADEVKTTYEYGPTTGPNNLQLRGTVVDAGGLNLRTCYTYDNLGRRISETQPEGTGSTCP